MFYLNTNEHKTEKACAAAHRERLRRREHFSVAQPLYSLSYEVEAKRYFDSYDTRIASHFTRHNPKNTSNPLIFLRKMEL